MKYIIQFTRLGPRCMIGVFQIAEFELIYKHPKIKQVPLVSKTNHIGLMVEKTLFLNISITDQDF